LSLSRAIPLHVAEKEVIGASHAELGAYLLGIWGLPESVIEAVAFHHTPEQVRQSEFDVLAALALAHALAATDDSAVFDGSPPPDPAIGPAYLESIRSPFSWEEARQRVSSRTTAAECEA
jgi:HD-like signal output (HDOD) protein